MAKRNNLQDIEVTAEILINSINKLGEYAEKIEKATGEKIKIDTEEVVQMIASVEDSTYYIKKFKEDQERILSISHEAFKKSLDHIVGESLKQIEEQYPKEVKGIVENQLIYNIHSK